MFTAALKGDLAAQLRAEKEVLAEGVSRAVRAEANKLRTKYRRQIRKAKLGDGLEKAFQVINRPGGRKFSIRAAAILVSKADRVHEAFTATRYIRARNVNWLVWPLDAAKAAGYAESLRRSEGNRPRRWAELERALAQGKRFEPRPTKRGNILLLARETKEPWFLLTRKGVRLTQRLDLEAPRREAEGLLAPRILAEIDKAEARRAKRAGR